LYGRLASGILAIAVGKDLTHDDFIDLIFAETGPTNGLLDDKGAQFCGTHVAY
jgi:hypothetical protein